MTQRSGPRDVLPGEHQPGESAAGYHGAGSHRAGSHRAGNHGAGNHGAGNHGAGNHGAGNHGAGNHGPDEHRQRSYRWEDPAISGDAARTLAGLDFFRAIADGTLPPPPIASTLGFSVIAIERGRAVFEFTPAEFHYNPIGSVHGGVYATLCDSACGCAVHSMLPAGAYYTSQDLTVKFVRGITASTGPLRCEGTVIHLGSRTALAQASLTDPAGRLYAYATSSCLIFRP